MGQWRPHGDNMRTMCRQHGDHRDVETTWGQCGDNMGCGDHRDVETMWGQHGDNMGTTGMWRQHGDNMGTTGMWRQHGDNMETTWDVETT